MVSLLSRRRAAPARRSNVPRFSSLGAVLLFLLFTTVVGVRRADAQTELTVAGCVVACSTAFVDFRSTVVCGGCLVWASGELRSLWLGDEPVPGWPCAKANIECA